MHSQIVETNLRPSCLERLLPVSGSANSGPPHGVCEEPAWRSPVFEREWLKADILVSRWVDRCRSVRRATTVPPSDRRIISVALKPTRLKLGNGSGIVFEGAMPAGTVQTAGTNQITTAEFYEPCDFVHFHVSHEYVQNLQNAFGSTPALGQMVVRDPLAELLVRTLIETDNGPYVEAIGQTFVMHIAKLELTRSTANALPKWRLKRVEEYIAAHLGETMSLANLAAAAGLSRMHFARQFRAATGLRPHEYVLIRRIESAKSLLSNTRMPLVDVALTTGFQTQSHFSTVFKHLTQETPARWRRDNALGIPC
jgi:AraC family transcriptional regulator